MSHALCEHIRASMQTRVTEFRAASTGTALRARASVRARIPATAAKHSVRSAVEFQDIRRTMMPLQMVFWVQIRATEFSAARTVVAPPRSPQHNLPSAKMTLPGGTGSGTSALSSPTLQATATLRLP